MSRKRKNEEKRMKKLKIGRIPCKTTAKKEETRKGNEGMKKVGRKAKWFNVLLKSHHPSKMKTDSSRVRVDFETKSKEWWELINRKEEDGGEWDRKGWKRWEKRWD